MLGRDGGNGHQPPILWMALHVVEQEYCGTLQNGKVLTQECLVTGKEIMLPQMGGEPGTTRREHAPGRTVHRSGDAPEIGIVVGHPTVTSIHLLGCLCPGLTQIPDQ